MAEILEELRDRLADRRAQLLFMRRWQVGSPEHTRLMDEVQTLMMTIKEMELRRKHLHRKGAPR